MVCEGDSWSHLGVGLALLVDFVNGLVVDFLGNVARLLLRIESFVDLFPPKKVIRCVWSNVVEIEKEFVRKKF